MLLSRFGAPARATLVPRLRAPRPVIVARVTAIGALMALFVCAASIVMAGKTTLPIAQADAAYINARVVEIDQGVRAQLVRMRSAGAIALARRDTREAIAEVGALLRPVQGAAGGAALQRAIEAELAFLDAVGSVLANARSPLRDRLTALDAAARGAIAELDGPRARRTGGVGALRRLWSGRAADVAPSPRSSGSPRFQRL